MLRFVRLVDLNETLKNTTDSELIKEKGTLSQVVVIRSNPYEDNAEFRLGNLFTGEVKINTFPFLSLYWKNFLRIIKI